MAEPPPPPPPAQWPRPQLTPACYDRILGMRADNRASQYSRPNSEILFSTPFPTCEVGYSRPQGSFGVAPYQNVIPMSLPPNQAQIQQGTGVFHPARESTESRRANYNNIRERRIKQVDGQEDNGNYHNGREENSSEGKNNKNGSKVMMENKKKKWNKKKNYGSEKKKEDESHVPNLPPGIVLPMEWPYPDSF